MGGSVGTNVRIILLLFLFSLIFGCATPQPISPEGSTEVVKQWLSDNKQIKKGDWMRATTLDGRVHEFSYQGAVGDDIHGGDTIIPMSHLKKLEVYQFATDNSQIRRRNLVVDEVFERQLVEQVEAAKVRWFNLYLEDGRTVTMQSPRVENGALVGSATGSFHDNQLGTETRRIPIRSVVGVLYQRGFRKPDSSVHPERWGGTPAEREAMMQLRGFLKPGDWVRVTLAGGEVREFQYRETREHQLVGGDGEVAVAEIKAMEIFPSPPAGPSTRGEAVGQGVAVGAVALMAILVLSAGAAGAFVVPMAP